MVMAGATFPARPAAICAEQVVRRMIRITGVYNYAPEDLEDALEFLEPAVGCFPFEELVAAVYPLREVNAALMHAETARPLRVALLPWGNEQELV